MIGFANQWAGVLLAAIWRATWQGGAFILAVWLLCRAFKGMPLGAKRWIWWLACLQLLVRLTIIPALSLPLLPPEPAPSYQTQTTLQSAFVKTQPVNEAPQQIPEPARPSLPLALAGAWLAGCALYLALFVRPLFAHKALVRRAIAPKDPYLQSLVDSISRGLRINPPTLRISPDAASPMVSGLWKPTIVLPYWTTTGLSRSELRLAVTHELVHLERHDLWLALVPTLAKGVFFFNPLAWLAAYETDLACEAACDAKTLLMESGSPADYAHLLLTSAQTRSSIGALGAAFGFRSLQRRILMLKTSPRIASPRAQRIAAALLALAIVCALPWTVTAQATPANAPAGTAPRPLGNLKQYLYTFVVSDSKGVISKSTIRTLENMPFHMRADLDNNGSALDLTGTPSTLGKNRIDMRLTARITRNTPIWVHGKKALHVQDTSTTFRLGGGDGKAQVIVFAHAKTNVEADMPKNVKPNRNHKLGKNDLEIDLTASAVKDQG